jgi:hypothetical protein
MPGLNGLTKLRTLLDAQHDIRNADLLLFRRPRGFISRMITAAGRGIHSHAAKAAWWSCDLFCLEVRELKGGRAVTLDSQVRKFPGLIDVFRANAFALPEMNKNEAARQCVTAFYDRAGSVKMMRRLAGCDYGYVGVLHASLLHLPFVRLRVNPDLEDDAASKRPPFCSQACALTDRVGGGVDPVPNLSDRLTEPADLARSPFYKYICTLVP